MNLPIASTSGIQHLLPATSTAPENAPGLDNLMDVDQLMFNRLESRGEGGCSNQSRYVIKNFTGHKVFTANQSADFCAQFYGYFEVNICDQNDQVVVQVFREANCMRQQLCISAPPGAIIGTMRSNFSWREPFFSIHDASGSIVSYIRGSCDCNGCGDSDFTIIGNDNATAIGCIRNQWTGLREMLTEPDNFGIAFPRDMDVRAKAMLLGTAFFVNFLYFDHDR